MRVAIFHDFFPTIGGGERTVLTLARARDATVYTTEIHRPSIERLGFGDVQVESLGDLVPRAPIRQMHASLRFATARVDADAYVLSGNWVVYAARRHHPNVAYCHTPVRAFYDLREPTIRRLPSGLQRGVARSYIALHSAADRIAWSAIDRVVTNSENTRRRIRRYHRRDARVVYPPTDVSRYRFEALDDFWLSVNRLTPEKRLEIQLDAFRRLPRERLVVVGGTGRADARYRETLRPPPNVEIRGEVDEAELARLYARCRGLICTAMNEDFGLTPVEAMASGKVVLAVDEGGFRESVVPGETGFLLPPNAATFAEKIASLSVEDLAARAEACRRRANAFDVSRFLESMDAVLREAVTGGRSGLET